jgi:hypothetical protein
MPGVAAVTREEFRLAYRDARKVHGFVMAFGRRLPDWPRCSLTAAIPLAAWRAACRYGDRLAFPPYRRADGRYRSRVR